MKSLIFQGHKLKQLRDSHSPNPWTMQDLAEISGIKRATLSELENGKNKAPREATVNALCDAFGVDAIYFYYAGDNLADLFPADFPADVREFVFDTSNIQYIQLAIKMKDPDIPFASIDNLLTQYLKSAKMILGK